MKMDFNKFFEMIKVFVYNELNKDFFKENTGERIDKCLIELEENENISDNMFEEIAELLNTSAEDGFETGFKTACELLSLILNPNGSKTGVSNKCGIPFNDEAIFDMLYYPKELDKRMVELDIDLKRKINPTTKEDFQLFNELDEIEADLSAECFKSGFYSGINLMKYLLK